MMENNFVIDILGWTGTAALLIAYSLVSAKKLPGDSRIYQGLNLAGSALLIINSFYYGAFPSVGVNVAWIGIAAITLARRKSNMSSDTNKNI